MLRVADFHAAQQHAEKRGDASLPSLQHGYRTAFRSEGERAARRFERLFTPGPLTAAADWIVPSSDQVYDLLLAQAVIGERTRAARDQMWRAQARVWGPLGLSFDQVNRLLEGVYPTLGQRITMIAETQREQVMRVIDDAWRDGLSVRDTASAIRVDALGTSRWRAEMIARTEILGAQNAASLLTARVSGAVSYKTWLAAQDRFVRDDHADADGQTVPVDQPFDVGGYQMMHPGDPSGPPEEVISCRCTLTYSNAEPGG